MIRFTKRPRKTTYEIVDIYSNDLHVGMFIGIQRSGATLTFGQCNINKSHQFRNILPFGFAKLLEYFGLDGITRITIEKAESQQFTNYLISLGFAESEKTFDLELDDETRPDFAQKIDMNFPSIVDRQGQLQNLISVNNPEISTQQVRKLVKGIIQKIKFRDRLGEEFWDYRSIVKLKNYINVAVAHNDPNIFHDYLNIQAIYSENVVNEEFIDFFIQTLIGSFKPYIRKAYLEEFYYSIDGKKEFPIPYIEKIIQKLLELVKPEEIDREKYRNWVKDNMSSWRSRMVISDSTVQKIEQKSRLIMNDFANPVKSEYESMVQALIDHYNDEKVFFGLENSFK